MAAVGVCLILGSCTRSSERVFTGTVFEMPYEVHVVGSERKAKNSDIEKALIEAFSEAEKTLWIKNAESELSQFNKSEKLTWLPASRGLVTVIEQALQTAKLTNGAWDPTAGKLQELYKTSGGKEPGPNTLAAAKAKIGYFHLEVRQEPLGLKKSRRGMIVDLMALAPAFAVDLTADALRKLGLSDYRVTIGRCARAAGMNAQGEEWPYTYPRAITAEGVPTALTQSTVSLSNRAATQIALGNEVDQGLWIDPRSGKRLQTDLTNVTVLGLTALGAEAAANGFFVLGKQAAVDLAKKQGIAAYFVAQTDGQGIAEATPLFPPTHRSEN